jgi:hypothetical protein
VGTKPVEGYCREVETYLCRKNDGHLIRVVGPSFELVSGWAEEGVPLKVAFRGIDRYFERYYRKGPRRRPVRIDSCAADVLDVFDEWRRALGLPAAHSGEEAHVAVSPVEPARARDRERQTPSLPAHLERAVLRLTEARARGSLGAAFDDLIDRVARELDRVRAQAGGVRGEAREAVLARLSALDVELLQSARALLDESTRASLVRETDSELAAFRSVMTPDAFARAHEAAIDRLVRERLGLPTLALRHP